MFARISFRLLFFMFAVGLWLIATQPGFAAPLGEGGPLYLPIVLGSGTQGSTPTPLTPTPTPPSSATPTPTTLPSDQELIASGLQQGKIDSGTSLLYRFYALLADERLPSEYRGNGSLGEDLTLFAQASDPALSTEVKAKLRPFLLRPDDPESIHTVKAGAAAQTASAGSSPVPCTGAWAAQSSTKPTVKARVHALCLNDYAEDIQAALALIESLWTPMTNLMGQPLPDLGGAASGSTDEIDFYLLDPLGVVWREGDNHGIRSGALAVAPAAEPFVGNRSSGYVLIARSDIGDPELKTTVAHEFFHVLQKAHNGAIAFHGPVEWWFTEASATWAEWYFVPESSETHVHPYFPFTFQTIDQPLHRSYEIDNEEQLKVARSAYAGYIWPFFVQQEKGHATMGEIWKELEAVGTDWEKGLRVLDEDYPFALHFHRFAFRNLNNDFAGDNPLGKRYVDLDAKFPDGWMPTPNIEEELQPMEPAAEWMRTDSIPALRAHYYHFTVAAVVRQVTFDLMGLQPLLNRKVGAMVKIKGKPWQMRELVPDLLTFCRSNPDQDIEEIWFVASHDQTDLKQTVAGSIKVKASKLDCGCDIDTLAELAKVDHWNAAITYGYDRNVTVNQRTIKIHESAQFSGQLEKRGTLSFQSTAPSGQAQLEFLEAKPDRVVNQLSGGGELVLVDPLGGELLSKIVLNFNSTDCTYSFSGAVATHVTDKDGQPAIARVGSIGGWFRPLPTASLHLQNHAIFDVHSYLYIVTHQEDYYYSDYALLLSDMVNEEELGQAQVTWSFTPVVGPEP